MSRARPRLRLLSALLLATACRSTPAPLLTPPQPSAYAIVEGSATPSAPLDTVDAKTTVGVGRARWSLRDRPHYGADFWQAVSVLDLNSANLGNRSMEERTFTAALKQLLDGSPEAAAVGFNALHDSAKDSLVRLRSRIGLTMALSWHSDWPGLAHIGLVAADSESEETRAAMAASVERWGRALGRLPPAQFDVPDQSVVLPMRRSAFGTPVVTIRLNGHPYEFWLDTGASMTLISADAAIASGVKLAAMDTLAIGVVAGHVDARAVYLDSLALGPVVVRGLGAAIVDADVLRLDQRVVSGKSHPIPIAGMIGTDVLRHLDVVLDAGAETITIRRARPMNVSSRNLFWVGYPVVRLVTHDGQPVLFGLDTGAEATYVTTTLLKKLPRTSIAARRMSLGGLGSERKRSSWIAREIPLSDGDMGITLRNVPIMPEQRWTFVDFDGVIGSDVALTTRMHLDFTNGVFDVRPSASLSKPTDASGAVKVF